MTSETQNTSQRSAIAGNQSQTMRTIGQPFRKIGSNKDQQPKTGCVYKLIRTSITKVRDKIHRKAFAKTSNGFYLDQQVENESIQEECR
jgi:hypothetical protein